MTGGNPRGKVLVCPPDRSQKRWLVAAAAKVPAPCRCSHRSIALSDPRGLKRLVDRCRRRLPRAITSTLVVLLLAGCWLSGSEPPGDKSEARRRAADRVDLVVDELSRGIPGPSIATARVEMCKTGETPGSRPEGTTECHVARSVLLPAAHSPDASPSALRQMAGRLDDLGCQTANQPAQDVRGRWRQGILEPDAGNPAGLAWLEVRCDTAVVDLRPADQHPCQPPNLRDHWCLEDLLTLAGAEVADGHDLAGELFHPKADAARARATGTYLFWIITADQSYDMQTDPRQKRSPR